MYVQSHTQRLAKSKIISFAIATLFSFLGVALITYGATTISTNIDTGGTLTVSGNATSTFGTGGFTIGTSQFVVQQTSGSVGIGTTSPWGLLSVNPNGISGPAFVVGSSTATNFVITNSGNIGVGTVNPSQKVHVYENTNGLLQNYIENPSTGSSAYSELAVKTDDTVAYVGSSGTSYSDAVFAGRAYYLGTTNGLNIVASGGSGDVRILTGGIVVTNERMRITSNGNVGIGTTSPNRILQIARNAGPQLLLTQPSAGLNLKHWYASTTAGSLTFGTLNDNLSTLTERLRIGNDGRMGIGTTTPTTMFQVATSTANATTTVEFGKASQNKGSCLKLYDSLGAVYYCRIDGGIFTCNTTTCE